MIKVVEKIITRNAKGGLFKTRWQVTTFYFLFIPIYIKEVEWN